MGLCLMLRLLVDAVAGVASQELFRHREGTGRCSRKVLHGHGRLATRASGYVYHADAINLARLSAVLQTLMRVASLSNYADYGMKRMAITASLDPRIIYSRSRLVFCNNTNTKESVGLIKPEEG